MSQQSETHTLIYCGIFGKALKACTQTGRELFLPLSQIRFRRPAPGDFMMPIQVTIPCWLARAKGLGESSITTRGTGNA